MTSTSARDRFWQRFKTDVRSPILLCTLLAVVCLKLPIQHYYSMGRYQHYALVVAALGLGYILKGIFSWRHLSFWLRLSIILTGVFLESTAVVLWTNPWLDWSVAVQTEEKENFRAQLIVDYIAGAAAIGLCWIKGWMAEIRAKRNRDASSQAGGSGS